MQHRGQAFTREQLLERLWRPNVTSNPRVVDTCIARIRRALAARGERDPFRTIANVGYAFERA
jgi:DNA-binding response OmpR family regulator